MKSKKGCWHSFENGQQCWERKRPPVWLLIFKPWRYWFEEGETFEEFNMRAGRDSELLKKIFPLDGSACLLCGNNHYEDTGAKCERV